MRRLLPLTAVVFLCAFFTGVARCAESPANLSPGLGSPKFQPTPERPIGWRGDGTGRWPDATPPIKWSRTVENGQPRSSGILWMTPVPAGASPPIVVGDRLYFGFDPYGLMCVNKADGRILWYRTHHYYDVMPEQERKSLDESVHSAYAKVKGHFDTELKRMSAAVSPAGLPDGQRFMTWQWTQEVAQQQKLLDDALKEADREKYSNRRQPWEWASATPVSDGKYVYMWYSHRVAACYDLDGNRRWATIEPSKGIGAEHGCHSSPVLTAGKFIVQYGNCIVAFDAATGVVAWNKPLSQAAEKGSIIAVTAAGQPFVVSNSGEAFRVADGERGWGPMKGYYNQTTTPIFEKDRLFFMYDIRGGLVQFPIPAEPGPKLQAAAKVTKLDEGFKETGASPLYVDGLIYAVSDYGVFGVIDPESSTILYEKKLPLTAHIEYVYFPGVSASPSFAGKYVYVMDNQGGTVVLETGREYKEVAFNKIETFEKKNKDNEGKETIVNEQTVNNLTFDGKLMFIRGQQYLYCIGSR